MSDAVDGRSAARYRWQHDMCAVCAAKRHFSSDLSHLGLRHVWGTNGLLDAQSAERPTTCQF
eukprot:3744233-Prymnesium_polylepis.1